MEIPPRVRGRAFSLHRSAEGYRNTPASAGKSLARAGGCPANRKYPRECGEEEVDPRFLPCRKEIPPRVRGRGSQRIQRPNLQGNTPASAGKSRWAAECVTADWKYPRECGEEPGFSLVKPGFLEIPPRVRGRASTHGDPARAAGNTPASAGKRPARKSLSITYGKYPRECGEE